MVGGTMLQVLKERDLQISELFLFDVGEAVGKEFEFNGKTVIVEESNETIFDRGMDICLFAVDGPISKKYAPLASAKGCVVIDNSSYWRMEADVPLVVPEVNGEDIFKNKGIISSPNCSTIQAMVALSPLHKAFNIKRVIYSTYQSVAGAGVAGIEDLRRTIKGEPPQCFPLPIAGNVIPRIDVFGADGYTGEEEKMIEETRKILHAPDMKITATTVRVPVEIGHSESVNLTFEKPYELAEVRKILENAPGIVVQDDPANEVYPTPRQIAGTDQVYVGRIRRDFSAENSLNLWIVADNVRKGAATNAVQIAEKLIQG
jgi:aspartate-semialdehyde dehydrogenase